MRTKSFWMCRSSSASAPRRAFLSPTAARVARPSVGVVVVHGDLAEGGVDQPDQVAGDQAQRLLQVDRRGDGLADVRAELQLLGVVARLLVEAGGLDRDRHLGGSRAQRLDL